MELLPACLIMKLTKWMQDATDYVTLYGTFCQEIIAYDKTDLNCHLHAAMIARLELIKRGAFTAEFLDGVQEGLRRQHYQLNSVNQLY